MNPQVILTVLFTTISEIHDAPVAEWIVFINCGIEDLVSELTDEEKMEIAYKLQSLNLTLGSRQWYRRLNICRKIHELI